MQNSSIFLSSILILLLLAGIDVFFLPDPSFASSSIDRSKNNVVTWSDLNSMLEVPNPTLPINVVAEGTRGSYTNVGDTASPAIVKCQGQALCLKGEVVKVANGKSFFVSVNNRILKIDLALIGLPSADQQAMMGATTFTRNSCLGGTVLIDQDDGQVGESIIGTVYCSPAKSLNAMLLDTGYVQLDRSQCPFSEFSVLDWARSRGC